MHSGVTHADSALVDDRARAARGPNRGAGRMRAAIRLLPLSGFEWLNEKREALGLLPAHDGDAGCEAKLLHRLAHVSGARRHLTERTPRAPGWSRGKARPADPIGHSISWWIAESPRAGQKLFTARAIRRSARSALRSSPAASP